MKRIRQSPNITDLNGLKTLLKAAKINSKIINEGSGFCTAGSSPFFYSLYVEDKDAAAAIKLINETYDFIPEYISYCRKCGSENISKYGIIIQYTKNSIIYRVLHVLLSALLFILGCLNGSGLLMILCWTYFLCSIYLVLNPNSYKNTVYRYYTFYYCNDCNQYFNKRFSDKTCYRKDSKHPFIKVCR